MTELPDLKRLTHGAKDELIHDLWDEVQTLRQKVNKPQKTSKNSSLPPTQPDQIIKAEVRQCQDCGHSIESCEQRLLQRYDKIDILPIHPIVTRVERYGCACPVCGQAQIGLVSESLSTGSPFSPRIAALVTTLRYGHAISYQRIEQLMWSQWARFYNASVKPNGLGVTKPVPESWVKINGNGCFKMMTVATM
ncbi:MAG: hypothetical protein VKJ24_14510 [Synechococcales bacterium]|nr:hypothetical protein [Synechococcales bacterium]